MARIQTNLMKDGVQYTLSDEANDIPVAEFAAGFAAEIGVLVEDGLFQLPVVTPMTAPAQQATAGDDDGIHYDTFVQVRVLPKGAGKVDVEFFGNSHKQPVDDFFTVKAPSWSEVNLAKLFLEVKPNIEPEFFTRAGTYSLTAKVGWKYGRVNSSGKRYKNVVGVYPLQGLTGDVEEAPAQEPEFDVEIPF